MTILEVLESAKINISNGKRIPVALNIAEEQLINAITLLEKGYNPFDDFDEIVDKYGSVEEAKEKETSND